jgi:hydrogenase expression/formation protein HypD
MKYIDEFRRKNLIKQTADKISKTASCDKVNIMEVCGTHTQNFRRFGLNRLIPNSINLIAGPGCPVCVSTQVYIDKAITLAKQKDIIILTFGDMLRVPGSSYSLEKQRAEGSDVRIVYSAWDSLKLAKDNPTKKIIFLAVGFETTAPTIGLSILAAKKENLNNLFFFSSLKLIPPAMGYLVKDTRLNLQGFLCPGHVSTIIGTKPYEFIPKRYKIPCCVAGFEPLDILEGIYMLLKQIINNKPRVINQYVRVVRQKGNPKAQKIISKVFKISDSSWRGLGSIAQSGLKIKNEFSNFDAERVFSVKLQTPNSLPGRQAGKLQTQCRCGDILKGLISPMDCLLFAKTCSPDNPKGPCMVSAEGACNAHYKYH